jgi:hypothetical protein
MINTPDEAIAAARAAWLSFDQQAPPSGQTRFSKDSIARSEPYTATLKDGVWTIRSTSVAGTSEGPPLTTVDAESGKVMTGFISEPPR